MLKFIRWSPGFIREVSIVALSFLPYVMFGVSRSYSSFSLPQLQSPNSTLPITQNEASWIASLVTSTNSVGCLIGGVLMDLYGRKYTIQSIFIPLIISWALIGCATKVEMIYIGILAIGVAAGMTFCSATYVGEISSAGRRGSLLSFAEPTYTFGILIANILVHQLGWSVAAIMFSFISAIGFFLMTVLPESPLWLITKSRPEEALKTLSWLRCKPAFEVYPEMQTLELTVTQLERRRRSFSEYLSIVKKSWKALRILLTMVFLQQNSGFSVLVGYTVMFFQQMKLPFDYYTAAMMYSTVSFGSSFIVPFAMDNYSRKSLLMVSSLGMCVTMFAISYYEFQYTSYVVKPYPWIPVVAACLYAFSCNLGVFPLPFIMAGEIFPPESRGFVNGIFGAAAFTYVSICVKIFPSVLLALGSAKVCLVFSIFSALNFLYGKYVVPETRGKSLYEIQQAYFK